MLNEIEESAKAVQESAKAVQEVAKTTSKGIEATEKLGGFVAKIIGEPLEEIIGIFTDKVRFSRWERRLRFTNKAKELITEYRLEDTNRIVPPKIALPIIENACLEEDDELQDLWANLLVSALDPKFDGKLRTAFIDILKQLEVIDVRILNYFYLSNAEYISERRKMQTKYPNPNYNEPKFTDFNGIKLQIMRNLNVVDENLYMSSVDNLMRVRLFISNDRSYDSIYFTNLGVDFVESCIKTESK